MHQSINHSNESIAPNAIIVTATAHLAYYLRSTSNKAQTQRIISLQEWLSELWKLYSEQTATPWIRLNSWQSTLLWQQLVRKQELALLRPQAIINQVQHAWQLVQQYSVPLESLNVEENSDSGLFAKLAGDYATLCAEHQWVDEFQLPQFLTQELKESAPLKNARWYLFGFDYFTPQLQTLYQHLRQLGADIQETKLTTQPSKTLLYHSYPDTVSEYRAAITWAMQKREQGGEHIGIIIPDLAKHGSRIQRITSEMQTEAPGINMELGLTLADYPIIADTLALLKWLVTPLPYHEASHLIRSAFWQGQDVELTARAQLTVALAERGHQQINIFSLAYYLQTSAEQTCELLLAQINTLLESYKKLPQKAAAQEWLQHVTEILSSCAWTQGRALNSAEYQTWERWKKLLAEMVSLDVVLRKPFNYRQLIKLIQQRTKQISFQPEVKSTGIHVMQTAESIGVQFSHLWISGLNAQTWPAPPEPNPFIPIKLQRQYGMPHSSYQLETQFSQQLTEHWCQSAPEVIFSYTTAEKDAIFLPSLLISEKINTVTEYSANLAPWQVLAKFPELNTPEDNYGLPCQEAKGGARLLHDQAECPFRAYAYYRLGLAQYGVSEPKDLGNALMRGLVVHRALQLVWRVLKDQSSLLKLTQQELTTLVAKQVDQALDEHYIPEKKINDIPDVFMQVEQECLNDLVLKWLAKEKLRTDFTVHQLEYAVVFAFNGMTLNMRIDRIDQLNNGELIIIDYKTAKPPSLGHAQERLVNSQLSLYALSETRTLAGTLFAKVGGQPVGFSGWMEEAYINSLPKTTLKSLVATDFSEQLPQWQEQLNNLAEEYLQGYAAVQPYPNELACRNCDLHLLCRVGSVE